MAAAFGASQWRVRRLARKTRELETVVAERTRELVAARDQLEQLASLDGLTGVANRRIFDRSLEQAWRRAQRGREQHRRVRRVVTEPGLLRPLEAGVRLRGGLAVTEVARGRLDRGPQIIDRMRHG